MAYDPNNMSALAYANGFTLWHYKSVGEDGDAVFQMLNGGYFNGAIGMMRRGDFIMINATDGSGIAIVTENDGREVSIESMGGVPMDTRSV